MDITYKDTKNFSETELKNLFSSVGWSSAKYPDKLKIALQNSDTVFSAWNDDKLIGLINVLDDNIMTAYIHFLLVNPEYQGKSIGKKLLNLTCEKYKDYLRIVLHSYKDGVEFYKKCGFIVGIDETTMFITSLND